MPDQGSGSSSLNTSETRWQLCIAAAQQGDREALGEIFQRLRAYLRVRAEEQLDGELQVKVSPSDVVQEALLEAHRGLKTFHGATRADLIVWVQGILAHRINTAYRRYRGAAKRNIARETRLHHVLDSSQDIELVTTDGSPSSNATANEEVQQLEAALKALSPRQEQVIRLRNELKLSFIEVATAMSCSPDAAQKLWTRAVKELSRRLNADASR